MTKSTRTISTEIEDQFWKKGYNTVIGVDEAGRGPLAGPVVTAAVSFSPHLILPGVYDSKALSPEKRQELFEEIWESAIHIGIGISTAEEIDTINILQATHLAAKRALAQIGDNPQIILTDYLALKNIKAEMIQPVVKGDQKCHCIAAASIIAKVIRDRLMQYYHFEYPMYGFNSHKGYPTPPHLKALNHFGPSTIHRLSFRPVGVFHPSLVHSRFYQECIQMIKIEGRRDVLLNIQSRIEDRRGFNPLSEVNDLINHCKDKLKTDSKIYNNHDGNSLFFSVESTSE